MTADLRERLMALADDALAEARGRALEWYGDQACALARYMTDKPPKTDGMMACVHALSLDAGKRAADALAAIPKE